MTRWPLAKRALARGALAWATLWVLVECATTLEEPASVPPAAELDAQDVAAQQAVAAVERLRPPPPRPKTPLNSRERAGLLQDANADAHRLGLHRKPSSTARGPLPSSTELARAYAEGRAINYQGTPTEAERWLTLVKFGTAKPGDQRTRGPLHPFDLVLVRSGTKRAWLHVVVPKYGFGPLDRVGDHRAFDRNQAWVLLSDRLDPDTDYAVYKRDGTASVAHQWGREPVIDDVAKLARQYQERTGVRLGVGDISRLLGGKLPGHWTHKKGTDVDVYLLDYPDDQSPDQAHPLTPRLVWHSLSTGGSIWSSLPEGRGNIEAPLPDTGHTPTALRLRTVAEWALPNDRVAYVVHNDPDILEPFDVAAQKRRAGRRFLHAHNRGYWPPHQDHVHLRWAFGRLETHEPPRP